MSSLFAEILTFRPEMRQAKNCSALKNIVANAPELFSSGHWKITLALPISRLLAKISD
jgi:hypothetical protein